MQLNWQQVTELIPNLSESWWLICEKLRVVVVEEMRKEV